MEQDVLFEDSPLAQYLRRQSADGATQARLEPNPVLLKQAKSPAAAGVSDEDAGPADHCYAVLLGRADARLAEDFADVREAVSHPPDARSRRTLMAVLTMMLPLLVATLGWVLGCAVAVAALASLLELPSWWLARGRAQHLAAVEAAFHELSAFVDCAQLSLSVVREVELVSRGYRVGAVLSPASRLEGDRRRLEVVRRCLAESLGAVRKAALQAVLAIVQRPKHAALAVDLEAVAAGLADSGANDTALHALSEGHARLCHFAMRALILQLRAAVARLVEPRSLLPSMRQLRTVCAASAATLRDVNSATDDWRVPAASAPPVNALTAGVVAALRTLGARVKLLTEGDEDGSRLLQALERDVAVLNDEWLVLRARLSEHDAAPQLQQPPPPQQQQPPPPLPPEHVLERLGVLDVEVIGDRATTPALHPQSAAAREAALEQVLQMYLGDGGEEGAPRKPQQSREERIEAMRTRKAAEEAAMAESRAVYALISELQHVLDHRRHGAAK